MYTGNTELHWQINIFYWPPTQGGYQIWQTTHLTISRLDTGPVASFTNMV